MSRLNAQNLQPQPLPKLAVNYQRVSTNAQGGEDRSGFSRQEAALANWRRINPEYEVRVIKEMISGKKNFKSGLLGQFLKDAQKGEVAPGTVLVVETWSRLSRGDMADCMQLMLDIFNAGLGVSFCDWGNQILRSLDETGGTVFQIVGAAQRSHGEWLEKRDRTLGAREWRKKQIAEHKSGGKSAVFGNFRFKPRSECTQKPGYPRWLDVDANGDWVHLEAEIAWVQHAFKLARDMGARRIARALRAMGVTQAESDEPIKEGDVSNLLRSVTVMGWRQPVHNNKPVGQPEKGVYSAIISQTEFDEVQVALKSRNFKTVPNGRHRHNLFEKRILRKLWSVTWRPQPKKWTCFYLLFQRARLHCAKHQIRRGGSAESPDRVPMGGILWQRQARR